MPRLPRRISHSNIYHVMLRGNERKNIFGYDEDKAKFLEILADKKQNNEYQVYAYCVMDNHVHLVIKENECDLAASMKRIGVSYAYYYNHKFKRVGHVFQDRFRSEAVENEAYLLAVIRYIHKNPQKAGITDKLSYKWSSYDFYLGSSIDPAFSEISDILAMFAGDIESARKSFIEFHNCECTGKFLDIQESLEDSVAVAKDIIRTFLHENMIKIEKIAEKEHEIKTEVLIRQLARETSLSKRRIAELTGVNREKVRKVLSKEPSL